MGEATRKRQPDIVISGPPESEENLAVPPVKTAGQAIFPTGGATLWDPGVFRGCRETAAKGKKDCSKEGELKDSSHKREWRLKSFLNFGNHMDIITWAELVGCAKLGKNVGQGEAIS